MVINKKNITYQLHVLGLELTNINYASEKILFLL